MKLPELNPSVIAIDGPAASGKSTIGFRLAELFGLLFFDTGIMYRAVTWAVLSRKLSPRSAEAVSTTADSIKIDILVPDANERDGRQNSILVDDKDITWQLRSPAVDQNVSFVAANPAVRKELTRQQRRIALEYGSGAGDKPGIVVVGRDIGTVVVPEAPVKIFLEASAEARARRRYLEQNQKGKEIDYNQVLEDIRLRDQRDTQRAHAPLRAAEDALIIDTSELTVDEVVERIVNLMSQRGGT